MTRTRDVLDALDATHLETWRHTGRKARKEGRSGRGWGIAGPFTNKWRFYAKHAAPARVLCEVGFLAGHSAGILVAAAPRATHLIEFDYPQPRSPYLGPAMRFFLRRYGAPPVAEGAVHRHALVTPRVEAGNASDGDSAAHGGVGRRRRPPPREASGGRTTVVAAHSVQFRMFVGMSQDVLPAVIDAGSVFHRGGREDAAPPRMRVASAAQHPGDADENATAMQPTAASAAAAWASRPSTCDFVSLDGSKRRPNARYFLTKHCML